MEHSKKNHVKVIECFVLLPFEFSRRAEREEGGRRSGLRL